MEDDEAIVSDVMSGELITHRTAALLCGERRGHGPGPLSVSDAAGMVGTKSGAANLRHGLLLQRR